MGAILLPPYKAPILAEPPVPLAAWTAAAAVVVAGAVIPAAPAAAAVAPAEFVAVIIAASSARATAAALLMVASAAAPSPVALPVCLVKQPFWVEHPAGEEGAANFFPLLTASIHLLEPLVGLFHSHCFFGCC